MASRSVRNTGKKRWPEPCRPRPIFTRHNHNNEKSPVAAKGGGRSAHMEGRISKSVTALRDSTAIDRCAGRRTGGAAIDEDLGGLDVRCVIGSEEQRRLRH